jgi:Family of unknown function (DUF5763)
VEPETRCKALTKKGQPCRAAATAGGLCYFHANPNKASELGRIGGRSKGKFLTNNSEPLPALSSMVAVRDAVDRLIADVYAGKLHPRIAGGLAPLLQLQLRALDATDTEGRLSRIERLVAKREQRSKSNGGKWPDKTAGGIGLFTGPVAASDSQKESGPPATGPTQQVAAAIADQGHSSVETRAPEAGSEPYAKDVPPQVPSDDRVGPRIQDAASRALQAEVDEQKSSESRVVVRVQDAAAQASEQEDSQRPISNVEPQAPSNAAAQEPTTKTAESCEKEAGQRLSAGAQPPPAASGETGLTTSATKSDIEIREELMKQAQEAWMTGKLGLGWIVPKQK